MKTVEEGDRLCAVSDSSQDTVGVGCMTLARVAGSHVE
jgi:hypothetical protein